MYPEKVEILIDKQITTWLPGGELSVISVNEQQRVKFSIYLREKVAILQYPKLDLEDYEIQLNRGDSTDESGRRLVVFSSTQEKVFRECFGMAVLRLYIGDEEFNLVFEVLATKLTANQAERMIRYLAERREHIIRVCLSRTMRPAGMKENGQSDPEMVLSTAEKIINYLQECRGEIKQHIRKKLIPEKVPAWKAEQSGSLIDPVDVVFNLDSLRPSDGRQDVILRGRTYSTSAIDATTLVSSASVEENIILIGGLYSIRRVIGSLIDEISTAFKKRKISIYDREYITLGEMIFNLTGGAMQERCQRVISSVENFIRMLENEFSIKFSGEMRPKITPYVRSSRLYRTIFEQYDTWYNLGSPSVGGEMFFIKLRSLSKIFEFFVLFRIFDCLEKNEWRVLNTTMSIEFDEMIPNTVTFEKDNIKIILSYEPGIFTFSGKTKHMELVKLYHPEYPGNRWSPDYTIRIENLKSAHVKYLILDAKYSNPYWVENMHIKKLHDKYYDHMAVFNRFKNLISRNQIAGIFAIFPEAIDQSKNLINMKFSKFGIDSLGPVMIPMVSGLPISINADNLMERWLSKAIESTLLLLEDSFS